LDAKIDKNKAVNQRKQDASDKKVGAARCKYEAAQQTLAKTEMDFTLAKEENDAIDQLIEETLGEIDELKQDLESVEEMQEEIDDEIAIFTAVKNARNEDRPLGVNNNPTAEDYCEAIALGDLQLKDVNKSEKPFVLGKIVGLRFLGCKEAVGHFNTQLGHLKLTLGQQCFPNDFPQREASISPASRSRQIAQDMMAVADGTGLFDRFTAVRRREYSSFSPIASRSSVPSTVQIKTLHFHSTDYGTYHRQQH
jgi:hypothetical protein